MCVRASVRVGACVCVYQSVRPTISNGQSEYFQTIYCTPLGQTPAVKHLRKVETARLIVYVGLTIDWKVVIPLCCSVTDNARADVFPGGVWRHQRSSDFVLLPRRCDHRHRCVGPSNGDWRQRRRQVCHKENVGLLPKVCALSFAS